MANVTTNAVDYAMVGVNMADLKLIIVKTYIGALKRGRRPKPVMVWGSPGVGKTWTVDAAGRTLSKILEQEVGVYHQLTSCLEPTDIAGVPFPIDIDGETVYTNYLPPLWAWLASEEYEAHRQKKEPSFVAPPMILFFDDIPASHFQTQTAFFKGVHEGKWGHLQQRSNVMVVAAGNRMEDNAGANDMPTALANRFLHLYANPSTDDWLSWAEGEGKIHPYTIGYMRQNKGSLNEFNTDVANRDEKAFASPRSWEMVSDLLWEGEISVTGHNVLFTKTIMGIIGTGMATEFLAFMQNTTAVVPPEEIVANPKKARMPSKKNLDALHATVASLEHHIRENPKDWKAGVQYAVREDMVPDVGILLATTVTTVVHKMESKLRTKYMADPVFVELFDRYQDVFDVIED
jgi:hypothetical protein